MNAKIIKLDSIPETVKITGVTISLICTNDGCFHTWGVHVLSDGTLRERDTVCSKCLVKKRGVEKDEHGATKS